MPNKKFVTGTDKSSKVLIQNYGLLWKRDYVDWKNKLILGSKTRGNHDAKKGRVANFWSQKGIYVLYNDLTPIYIGQVGYKGNKDEQKKDDQKEEVLDTRILGKRLEEHLADQLSQKWNRFSWFGFHKVVNKTTKYEGKDIYQLGTTTVNKHIYAKDEVHVLEALMISLFVGNVQNKQDGGFSSTGVIRYAQLIDEAFISTTLAANDPYSYGLLYDMRKELVTKEEFEEKLNKLTKTIEELPAQIKKKMNSKQGRPRNKKK